MNKLLLYIALALMFLGCGRVSNSIENLEHPPIYPDYVDVTIPINVAPLNFGMRDSVDRLCVELSSPNESLTVWGRRSIKIPIRKWKTMLRDAQNQSITVRVFAKVNGQWFGFKVFQWRVVPDSIDPYLSYRLIEPGYEVWNKIQLVERHVESFDERILADNNLTEDACMNCHIYGNNDPNLSMFHIRGPGGGTVLNQNGSLRKINSKNNEMIANAIYGNFHPLGRFAVFSTNKVIPEFHTYRSNRLEVYDSESDLVVFDWDENKVVTHPFLSDTTAFETFPVFSADGRFIYFCRAPWVKLPEDIKQLKYSICRISFDAQTATLGAKIDTLWNAETFGASVSHLKTSPDGNYLLYTVSDYGTFPIWHREADLQLIDLRTGTIDSLTQVNAFCSDSYHSWSSNSRWFVFASKRDDGVYGKPYFSYVDAAGQAHKPFVLPQRDPSKYDQMLKSFNIPELSKGQVPFSARDIEKLYWNRTPESMN